MPFVSSDNLAMVLNTVISLCKSSTNQSMVRGFNSVAVRVTAVASSFQVAASAD